MKKFSQLFLLLSMALLGQNGFAQNNYELEDNLEEQITTEQLRQFTGEFESETLPAFELYIENNLLMAVLGNQPPLPFVPTDQNLFANQRVGALLEFKSDGDQILYFLLK